jgi:hypothetical protein
MLQRFGNLGASGVARFDPAAKPGAPDMYVTKLRMSGAPGVQRALNFMPGGPDSWLWDNVEDPDTRVSIP